MKTTVMYRYTLPGSNVARRGYAQNLKEVQVSIGRKYLIDEDGNRYEMELRGCNFGLCCHWESNEYASNYVLFEEKEDAEAMIKASGLIPTVLNSRERLYELTAAKLEAIVNILNSNS